MNPRKLLDLLKQVRRHPTPEFAKEKCPICENPLSRFQSLRSCRLGHVFRDEKAKGDLPNSGIDHRGKI